MDEIRQTILGARAAQVERITKGMSNSEEVLADETALRKGDDEELNEEQDPDDVEDTEKGDTEGDVEKSDIAEEFGYKDMMDKTGKEIKEQISTVILPTKTAALEAQKAEADKLLAECGATPTHDPCKWMLRRIQGIEIGYKTYHWEETCFREQAEHLTPSFTAEDHAEKQGNCPADKAQAEARRKYNDVVDHICNLIVDIKTLETMQKNLKDSQSYKLTTNQLIVLGF